MPRVYQITGKGPATDVTVAYTNDSSVGPGCQNAREDVLLVQHLLRIAWDDAPGSLGFKPPGEKEPIAVDGLAGAQTARFIKFFQEEAARRGANVARDGRVDPVRSGGPTGAISGRFYTVLAMNSARNSRRRANQADITSDPGFPQELRRHFVIDW